MTKNNDKLEPYQGSIDARKDPIFEEEYYPSKIKWLWEEGDEKIEGTLTPSCFTRPLKKLFLKHGIHFETITQESTILKSDLDSSLDINKISYMDSQRYVRIRFSGITAQEYEENAKAIQAYLDDHNIAHKKQCSWICDENAKQSELTAEFIVKHEELR